MLLQVKLSVRRRTVRSALKSTLVCKVVSFVALAL